MIFKFTTVITGDSPARAFESGNQVNGHYPCHCGADARMFNTPLTHLCRPKYLDSKDRIETVRKTNVWDNRKDGDLSPYENMNVSFLTKN